MKLLAALSTSALVCILVFGRTAIAQGPGYVCGGPVNVCPNIPADKCASAKGTCPDGLGDQYNGYSADQAQKMTACFPGSGTCYTSVPVNACQFTYYNVRNYLDQCSNQCGSEFTTWLACPL